MSKTTKTILLAVFGILILFASGCSNNAPVATDTTIDESTPKTTAQPEVKNEYINSAFGYKFIIPDGATINTGMVDDSAKSSDVEIKFIDNKIADLSAMNNPQSSPELRGRQDLSAKEYVQEWWNDNDKNTNPNVKITLSSIFSKNINGIEWFGFTATGALNFANDSGSSLLSSPRTVMVTKKGTTFYKWQFDEDVLSDLKTVLSTFVY